MRGQDGPIGDLTMVYQLDWAVTSLPVRWDDNCENAFPFARPKVCGSASLSLINGCCMSIFLNTHAS
jgi:hypothetical protein